MIYISLHHLSFFLLILYFLTWPLARWASISVSFPDGPILATVAFFFRPRFEGAGITTTCDAASPSFLSTTGSTAAGWEEQIIMNRVVDFRKRIASSVVQLFKFLLSLPVFLTALYMLIKVQIWAGCRRSRVFFCHYSSFSGVNYIQMCKYTEPIENINHNVNFDFYQIKASLCKIQFCCGITF